jgi:REP element-mobilizing transposase RayT
MNYIKLHRNSQKRFYGQDKIYFITTNTVSRFPFFKEDLSCELLIENLKVCKEIKNFKLYGFTIISDHVHLLLKPIGRFNISQIMQFLKRHFSRDINFVLNNFPEGEIREFRLQNEKYENFQNVVNAYDEKLKQIKNNFIKKYGHNRFEIGDFKWQQSFYDHVIRHEKDFFTHLNYIALNCIKHKICYDENKYKWSFLNLEYKDLIDNY